MFMIDLNHAKVVRKKSSVTKVGCWIGLLISVAFICLLVGCCDQLINTPTIDRPISVNSQPIISAIEQEANKETGVTTRMRSVVFYIVRFQKADGSVYEKMYNAEDFAKMTQMTSINKPLRASKLDTIEENNAPDFKSFELTPHSVDK